MGLAGLIFGKVGGDPPLPIPVAILAALGVGTLGGSINAFLITRLRLPPLIVTLATFSLFRGLAEALTHGVDTFTGFPESFLRLGQGTWLGLPAQTPLFLGVAVI